MSRTKSGATGKGGGGRKRRTRRACDRCRLKKAKCDGGVKCGTCKANNSACTYTARRGREARSYYCRMREVLDEALQRLYWACRHKMEFPGEIPDESTGVVTTEAILNGLGLTTPDQDDSTSPVTLTQHQSSTEHDDTHEKGQLLVTPPAESGFAQNEYSAIPQTPMTISPSTYARQISTVSPSLHSPTSSKVDLNLSMDTQPQDILESPQMSTCEPHPRLELQPALKGPGPGLNADSYLDVDAFLDTSSCDFPNTFQPADNFGEAMHWEPRLQQAQKFYLPEQQAVEGTVSDGYLSPWPGSLAAAYQSVDPV
ncbi:hypothetical protein PV05_01526 [Exophiala xenobiotica]|uniref:Zn(2)-C6 fungal-type domain-containing protein n=1 Tax=Exophiala xenobiotica TaxID=348802 RepID=A0A0D2FMS5_9EURO|nr:uncharacterized protein PV05_01526 [Exophiala xenobiotica]KIW61399.1 hypothetical protein PV05_01526 [Exophiala xenobiotica]